MSVSSNVRNWFRRSATHRPTPSRLGLEPLDAREVPAVLVGSADDPSAAEPLPVLMVIANRDFYYRESAGDAADYGAVVFVGGWGASSYQYAFSGTCANAAYSGSADAPATAADDVWVDGKVITGQNFNSAR